MLKVILVILIAVVATTFATDNMHNVELGLIVGRPVHVRLFFLLMTAFLLGCLIATLTNLYLNARSAKRIEPVQDTEQEDFFE